MHTNLEILLIEDLVDDQDLICHLLNKQMDDINITCEDDKEKVINLLKHKNYDLIIIDYFLEGFTGLELIDNIRALKGFDIPIIMITADESEDVALKSIQHGVDDFIVKTLKGLKELPQIIRRTIKRADIHKIKFTAEHRIINTGDIFQNLCENASEMIFTLWPDGTFVNANEATLNTLGLIRTDINIKNFVEFVDTSDRGQFKSSLNSLFTHKKPVTLDLVLWNSSGMKINVSGTGQPHFANGKVVATNWIFRNVTSDKYVESLLWDDYHQYSGIFNYIPVAVLLSDRRGVILQANTAANNMLGYGSTELQGMHIRDITHPEDVERSLEYHKKLMSGELDNYAYEKRYRHKSGNFFWTEVSASLVKNSKGEPMYGIAHIKDISDLKYFENLLGKLAGDLTRVNDEYVFDRLSARLIELLKSDFVFISYLSQDRNNRTVISLLFRDKANVLQENDFEFPQDLLDDLITDDELIIVNGLTKNGKSITSYGRLYAKDMVAIPLRDGNARVIGVLGTIFKQSTQNHSMITTILRIAGSKISDQLQHEEAELARHDQDPEKRPVRC